jgi:hypothetical protein
VLPSELNTFIASLLYNQRSALYDEGDICRDIASSLLVGNETCADIGRALANLLCPHADDPELGELWLLPAHGFSCFNLKFQLVMDIASSEHS